MKITDADHTNWRVKDLERSLRFYRDILGLEPFGLEECHRGERPIVSLRVTPTFILHLRPDPEFEPAPAGGYDHLGSRGNGAGDVSEAPGGGGCGDRAEIRKCGGSPRRRRGTVRTRPG